MLRLLFLVLLSIPMFAQDTVYFISYTHALDSVTTATMGQYEAGIARQYQSFVPVSDSLINTIGFTADSLLGISGDTLTQAMKSRVKTLSFLHSSALATYEAELCNDSKKTWISKKKYIGRRQSQQVSAISALMQAHPENYWGVVDDSLVAFYDAIVAINDSLIFSSLDYIDNLKTRLADSVQICKDAIYSLVDNLKSDRIEELAFKTDSLEQDRYRATRLTIYTEYITHTMYRGRDYNLKQSSISPTFTFRHRVGLSATGGFGYYSNMPHKIGGYTLAASFDRQFTEVTSIYVSYTYCHFFDHLTTANSYTNGNIQANVQFDFDFLRIEPRFQYDLSKNKNDYCFSFFLTAPILIKERIGYANIYLFPSFTYNFGREELANLALISGNQTSLNHSFTGVMGYEFSLPLVYESSRLSVSLAANYLLPRNVPSTIYGPVSRNSALWNGVLSIGVPIVLEKGENN